MKVYHGSFTKIEKIDLSKCIPNKDFGQGFYVTKFREHAESWAKVMGKRYKTEGVVTEFLFYDSPFTERLCSVKHFNEYDEEWLDFVISNRNPMLSMHDYDIVEGPVADDKVQNRIFDFLKGSVSKYDFLNELRYHEETHQICFCTLKSLLTLEQINNDKTLNIMHIGEPLVEKLMLDNQIDEIKAADLFYNSHTFTRLADETTEFHKKDWEEIYTLLLEELDS
jgi:hypothetical protein